MYEENNNGKKFNEKNSLWLPEGSIRSIIALIIVLTFCIYLYQYHFVPEVLGTIVSMILGFYFGSKSK